MPLAPSLFAIQHLSWLISTKSRFCVLATIFTMSVFNFARSLSIVPAIRPRHYNTWTIHEIHQCMSPWTTATALRNQSPAVQAFRPTCLHVADGQVQAQAQLRADVLSPTMHSVHLSVPAISTGNQYHLTIDSPRTTITALSRKILANFPQQDISHVTKYWDPT